MSRVIKMNYSNERKMTHKKCGAVIGYNSSDIKYYDDMCDIDPTVWKYIICPNCGQYIYI